MIIRILWLQIIGRSIENGFHEPTYISDLLLRQVLAIGTYTPICDETETPAKSPMEPVLMEGVASL